MRREVCSGLISDSASCTKKENFTSKKAKFSWRIPKALSKNKKSSFKDTKKDLKV
jgi:hypothetical protein